MIFRLFVSSTFSDMQRERALLQEVVFPRVRALCESRASQFQPVDLRWGVSEEAALDQQAMAICLGELRRCQQLTPKPNLLMLLGDRYGWVPLPTDIPRDEMDELLSQTSLAEQQLLVGDSTAVGGHLGWYRLDANSVPAQYMLRRRDPSDPTEADADAWRATEDHLHSVFSRAINAAEWSSDDPRRAKYHQSATNQEIVHGALELAGGERHALAMFRDIAGFDDLLRDIPASEPACAYVDLDPSGHLDARRHADIVSLRQAIEVQSNIRTYHYPGVWQDGGMTFDEREFAERVYAWLADAVTTALDEAQVVDPLAEEATAHREYAVREHPDLVGQRPLRSTLRSYLVGSETTDSGVPLVITGPSGSGKTALLADVVRHAGDWSRDATVISRFISMTPRSCDLVELLHSLCSEIHIVFDLQAVMERRLANIKDAASFLYTDEQKMRFRLQEEARFTITRDYGQLTDQLAFFLSLLAEQQQCVIVLDALDQLNEADHVRGIEWLPARLPGNVRILLSVLDADEGVLLPMLKERVPARNILRVPAMGREDAAQLMTDWLGRAGRTLQPRQRETVLDGFMHCPLPLYLRMAVNEAISWRSYDAAQPLGHSIDDLWLAFLTRVEEPRSHGEPLVRRVLGYLGASRYGLSEFELLEVVSSNHEVMRDYLLRHPKSPKVDSLPFVAWSRLHATLAPYLSERAMGSDVLISFSHRSLVATISIHYLHGREAEMHGDLAAYFAGKPTWLSEPAKARSPHRRKCAELTYQFIRSGVMWPEAMAALSDIGFLEARAHAGTVAELLVDYGEALKCCTGQDVADDWRRAWAQRIRDYTQAVIAGVQRTPVRSLSGKWRVLRFLHELVSERHSGSTAPPAEIAAPFLRFTDPGNKDVLLLRAWRDFISSYAPWLLLTPCIAQLAHNSASDGPVSAAGERDLHAHPRPWLRQYNRPPAVPLGAELRRLHGHRDIVRPEAVLSETGEVLIAGQRRFVLPPESRGERQPVAQIPAEATQSSITADGRLAVYREPSAIRAYDLTTRQTHEVARTGENLTALRLTPDGRLAIAGGWNGDVYIWDLATTEMKTFHGLEHGVADIHVAPDGKHILCDSFGAARVWDVETGARWALSRESGYMTCYAFRPDCGGIVAGCSDGCLRIWRAEDRTWWEISAHAGRVGAIHVSPDGCYCISTGDDAALQMRLLESGDLVALHPVADLAYIAGMLDGVMVVSDHRQHQFLGLEGIAGGPPFACAVRRWQFGEPIFNGGGHWDDVFTICCPWCQRTFTIEPDDVDSVRRCRQETCSKQLAVSPMVCDNSRWLR